MALNCPGWFNFCQVLKKPISKRPKSFNILPNLWNRANSGHTAFYPLLSTKSYLGGTLRFRLRCRNRSFSMHQFYVLKLQIYWPKRMANFFVGTYFTASHSTTPHLISMDSRWYTVVLLVCDMGYRPFLMLKRNGCEQITFSNATIKKTLMHKAVTRVNNISSSNSCWRLFKVF